MSLRIDPDKVVSVLINDGDGWHQIEEGSFELDSYEFVSDGGYLLHGGGDNGICSTGFCFRDVDGRWIFGPLTSLVAVGTD